MTIEEVLSSTSLKDVLPVLVTAGKFILECLFDIIPVGIDLVQWHLGKKHIL